MTSPSPPEGGVRTEPVRRAASARHYVAHIVAGTVLLGFVGWTILLINNVATLRADVGERVQWLVKAQKLQRSLSVERALNATLASNLVDAIQASPDAGELKSLASRLTATADSTQHALLLDRLITDIRRQTAEASRNLGATWTQVYAIAICAITLALLTLVLLVQNRRRSAQLARQLEATEQARAAEEHASRQLASFIATLGHEIRSPLTAMVGMAQLLRESDLTAAQHSLASIVERSGWALVDLTQDVLDLSRIKSGAVELVEEPFDLSQLIEEVLLLYGPVASSKNLELCSVHHVGAPRWILGDAGRVRQILVNLVSNALKFTERGGVRVDVWPQARIVVRDTGPGMGPEQTDKVFQPFVRLEANHTEEGTGLGLTISRRLAVAMGGDISVKSVPGEGSAFSVTLCRDALPDTPGPVSCSLSNGHRAVLLDGLSELMRDTIAEQLAIWGIPVESGADPLDTSLLHLSKLAGPPLHPLSPRQLAEVIAAGVDSPTSVAPTPQQDRGTSPEGLH